jgi:hypothetical protein
MRKLIFKLSTTAMIAIGAVAALQAAASATPVPDAGTAAPAALSPAPSDPTLSFTNSSATWPGERTL